MVYTTSEIVESMHRLAHAKSLFSKEGFVMNIGRLFFGVMRSNLRRADAGPPIRRTRLVRATVIGLLALAALVVLPVNQALGQIPSVLDTFRVVNVSTAPSDTFFLDFYMKNVDSLGGYNMRVRFDPTVLQPLLDTIIGGENPGIRAEIQFLRGDGFWSYFGAGVPEDGVWSFYAANFPQPGIFFLPGSGVDVRSSWMVLPSATPQATSIVFENDPIYPANSNTLSDYHGLGTSLKRPVLVNGTVNISTGTGDPPVISNCPGPFTTNQGNLVQFSVTATDPNGDNLDLTASNLPVGATFTPSNPVSGNTSVTGTFQWIPSESQSGNFLVSFRATDQGGLSSSFCTVSITVSTVVNGNPPDIMCQASTITVDQGQLVEFNVSASDVDGDTLTLSPSNLPLGATFTPTNPVVGPSPVNGVFHWTPSFTQSGIFSVSFQVQDPDGNQDICNTSIVVNEVAVDQLFTTSASGQKPQGGVSGTPNVVVPIDLVTSQAVYGVQLDFIYDPVIFTPTQVQASDRLTGFSLYDNLGEEAGRIRILAFDLTGASIGSGTSSVLFNVVGNMNSGLTPGSYPIEFEDAWESINPDPEAPSVPLATTNGVIVVDNLGDANLDTRIDVADVVTVVGYILGNFSFDLRQFVAGDVTVDALLDVFDVQGILNLIFGLPINPAAGQPGTEGPATVDFVYDATDGPYGAYHLTTDAPVDIAGVQLEVVYDSKGVGLAGPETMSASSGFDLTYKDDGRGHLVALLIDPVNTSRIPTGRSEMLRIPLTRVSSAKPDVLLNGIKLAASDAGKIEVAGNAPLPKTFSLLQNYPNPFNPSTTIAFALGSDDSGAPSRVRLDIYNVLGQRVTTLVNETLPPGRYEYQWSGRDGAGQPVASGLYFYRLTTNKQSETKKMVLLK